MDVKVHQGNTVTPQMWTLQGKPLTGLRLVTPFPEISSTDITVALKLKTGVPKFISCEGVKRKTANGLQGSFYTDTIPKSLH